MAGTTVSRSDLDWKVSRTVIEVREAFENVAIIKGFLDQNPSNGPEGDLLTKSAGEGGFGYTEDEAYLVRLVFDQFNALDVEPILETARRLTGLE